MSDSPTHERIRKKNVPEPTIETAKSEGGLKRGPERTCIGCGRKEDPEALLRLVVDASGEVAVDLAGKAFGRGAWIHASPACLDKGGKRGLSKSFRATVRAGPEALAAAIVQAAERRVTGLLMAALRSKQAVLGADAVTERAAQGQIELLVVACDSAATAGLPVVTRAIAEGRAVAWGTKSRLGALAGRAEVAVLGIQSAKLADAVRATVRMSSSVASKVVAAEVR